MKIVYHSESGNQAYVTEFDIGDNTIQAWRKIDRFYRQMAEKDKRVKTQVESPESDTSRPINSAEE